MRLIASGRFFTIIWLVCASGVAGAVPPTTPPVELKAYEGKIVLLDFWASWCKPCRRSFPWMNEMHARYGDDGLVIIAVNLDGRASDAESFLHDYPADFRIVYDPGGRLARDYGVVAMPSSYVFDREGNQVARHLGFQVRRRSECETLIVQALQR